MVSSCPEVQSTGCRDPVANAASVMAEYEHFIFNSVPWGTQVSVVVLVLRISNAN